MLNPAGNNTRANLVVAVLKQLNDPNNEFWQNSDIHEHLQRAVTALYNANNRMNSERNLKSLDFYYEASSEWMLVTSQYLIDSSSKWIDVDLGAGEVSAAVPESVYNGLGALKDAVTTALQTLDATFECSYDVATAKFTIKRTGNFTIKWATGAHAGSTFGEVLGFGVAADVNGGSASFTAGSAKTHSSVGRMKVTMLEDRTDRQPGPLWHPSDSLDQQHQYNWLLQSAECYSETPKYIVQYTEHSLSEDDNTTIDLIVRASPIPVSRRTLRIHYQGVAPELGSDTIRSGLMPEEEEVAVLRTCILAKFQEIDKAPPEWKDLLKGAEMEMRQTVRPIKRGPKRITYVPD